MGGRSEARAKGATVSAATETRRCYSIVAAQHHNRARTAQLALFASPCAAKFSGAFTSPRTRWDRGAGAWALRNYIGTGGASKTLIGIGFANAIDASAHWCILLGADGRAARAVFLRLKLRRRHPAGEE
jgi:hypothetical protein